MLAWQDHLVIVVYLLGTIALGVWLSRKQSSDDEYFLGGRRMPWFAVGISVIATLLSSLTYLSEPGEVWKSGVVNVVGKMAAIPLEMLFVWLFCIPFLMRFRYTSVYEYLEHRFSLAARLLGITLFGCLVISWMGFVVLASARALATVTGLPLVAVIATVGLVATIYTVLGGLRAVIWTDVAQVALLLGGALAAIGFIMVQTQSGPLDWYRATIDYQTNHGTGSGNPWFSLNPFERSTMVTVALSMFVWHVCTHTANQMSVQRYFSTHDLRAARRSFVTGSLFGVAINLVLMVVGLALLFYYVQWLGQLSPEGLNPDNKHEADLIFPKFVVQQLPPGLSGAIMAAVLAAAMSSIDSGVNSLATVLSIEWRDRDRRRRGEGFPTEHTAPGATPVAQRAQSSHVRAAQLLTLLLGSLITLAAYALDLLPGQGNIVEMMSRTFNSFIGSLGGLFFLGMFFPRTGSRAAIAATLAGMAASVVLGYGQEMGLWAEKLSFTLIIPGSLLATLVTGGVLGVLFPAARPAAGLTWFDRHRPPEPTPAVSLSLAEVEP